MFTVIHVVASGMPARMALSVGAGIGTLTLLSGCWFFLPRHARKADGEEKGAGQNRLV